MRPSSMQAAILQTMHLKRIRRKLRKAVQLVMLLMHRTLHLPNLHKEILTKSDAEQKKIKGRQIVDELNTGFFLG